MIGANTHAKLTDAMTSSEDVEQIDVSPANNDLALLANDLVFAGVGPEGRLAKALGVVAENYDDIFIDCPPSLSLLTLNALVAAHQVLIVTEPELYSGRGVGKLLDTIDSIREHLKPAALRCRRADQQVRQEPGIPVRRAVEIRQQLTGGDPPVLVMPTVVPRWTTVMRTTDAGADIADFNHPAARRLLGFYRQIAQALDPNVPEPTDRGRTASPLKEAHR